MEINITVDNVDLTSVIDGYGYDGDGDRIDRTLGDLVAEKLTQTLVRTDHWNDTRKQVQQIRGEVIREQISAQVTKAMSEPMRRTNTYGEAVGEETTLRAEIMRLTQEELLQPQKRDSYNRQPETAVQAFIRAEISQVITKELREVFAEEKKKVVAAVQSEAARLLADAVREGLRK